MMHGLVPHRPQPLSGGLLYGNVVGDAFAPSLCIVPCGARLSWHRRIDHLEDATALNHLSAISLKDYVSRIRVQIL